MNKEEFMRQLEQLLADVSEEEKIEALEYYRGYFEDAGEENEERILRELESPEKVAHTIKADLGMGKEPESDVDNAVEVRTEAEGENAGTGYRQAAKDSTGKIVLITIIAILTFPLWVGIIAGLFGSGMGILGALFGIAVAGAAVAGALYIAGAVVFGVGVSQLVVSNVAAGIALMGAGCLVLALAILATIACVWLYGRFIPWLIRGIVSLCRRVFSGKGRTA